MNKIECICNDAKFYKVVVLKIFENDPRTMGDGNDSETTQAEDVTGVTKRSDCVYMPFKYHIRLYQRSRQ